MSQRTTEIKKLHQSKAIVRDKQYYFNTLDIEHDLLKKAADIAERMMTAFMREHKVEVSVNVEDIANKIIDKIQNKLVLGASPREVSLKSETSGGFVLDDTPVVIKTDRVEVKGNLTTVSKTKDTINENIDLLENLQI
jgi:hypothetical protein